MTAIAAVRGLAMLWDWRPTSKSPKSVQPLLQKYSDFQKTQIKFEYAPLPGCHHPRKRMIPYAEAFRLNR
jgi:hypothetical protein